MVDENGPSLEPPSLFGSRRKKKEPATPAPAAAPVEGFGDPAANVDESPTTILDDVPTTAAASAAEPAAVKTAASPLTPPPAPAQRRARRAKPNFAIDGRIASGLTGLVVGLGIVAATAASFGLCDSLRGTNSCGGPGVLLLLAILIGAVTVGAALLRLAKVAQPVSTSVLAVGLVSVIALLFLVEALFSRAMIVVIPLVAVATYVGSYWVTSTFDEAGADVNVLPEPETVDHDLR